MAERRNEVMDMVAQEVSWAIRRAAQTSVFAYHNDFEQAEGLCSQRRVK